MTRALLALFVCLPLALSHAHNPDTSYLRCVIEPHEISFRFSFDLATLYRVVGFDVNATGQVSRRDMESLSNYVYDFLEQTVPLEINGKRVKLGRRLPMGWPPEAGQAIQEKDYHAYLLNFSFVCSSAPIIEDFQISFNVFNQLGSQHTIISDIEQQGRPLEVKFTEFEPDYLYDTGWTVKAAPSQKPISQDHVSSAPAAFAKGVSMAWGRLWWPFAVLAGAVLLRGLWCWLLAGGISALIWSGTYLYYHPHTGNPLELTGVNAGQLLAAAVVLPLGLSLRRLIGR